ncbi:hypothetical protein V5799_028940 [Amblyomma americanum]|uniref:Insulin-like domain-containing protein n=1 Tax=Amblyomma americanum TaxID=6943 RepID=A0AAQ4DBF3_AMBAM
MQYIAPSVHSIGCGISTARRPFIIYRPSPQRRDGATAQGGAGEEESGTSAEVVVTTAAPEPAIPSARHYSSSGSGGIVDECCRKACSFSTLASYCALPSEGSSLEAFNLVATAGSASSSSLTSSSTSSEGGDSSMQRDQGSSALLRQQQQRPEPPTTTPPPRIASPSRLQTAHEVNREHNEVDNANPHNRLGMSSGSRHTTGRMLLPSMPFLTSPEDDTPFASRAGIGTFSRHRPYFYVVQAAFNEDAEDERLDA